MNLSLREMNFRPLGIQKNFFERKLFQIGCSVELGAINKLVGLMTSVPKSALFIISLTFWTVFCLQLRKRDILEDVIQK